MINSRWVHPAKDGVTLFEAVQRLDLEGIVAKRRADSYAPETTWYKIKNLAYTQGEGRWELFRKRCAGAHRRLRIGISPHA